MSEKEKLEQIKEISMDDPYDLDIYIRSMCDELHYISGIDEHGVHVDIYGSSPTAPPVATYTIDFDDLTTNQINLIHSELKRKGYLDGNA